MNPQQGTHIQMFSGSQVVVHCLRRGGLRSQCLNAEVIAILRFIKKGNLFLAAAYIQGTMNVLADGLSRQKPLQTEWSLDSHSFQQILSLTILYSLDS